MAFGMTFGEHYGKLFLTLFRLIAVAWGFYFIQNTLIKQRYSNGLIFCGALILAGALGNSVDSVFFGKILLRVIKWQDFIYFSFATFSQNPALIH
jgi:signal peptidase II